MADLAVRFASPLNSLNIAYYSAFLFASSQNRMHVWFDEFASAAVWLLTREITQLQQVDSQRREQSQQAHQAISCQDFAQKGQGVTCLCEPEVDKGNPVGQTEMRTVPLKSEQGGSYATP